MLQALAIALSATDNSIVNASEGGVGLEQHIPRSKIVGSSGRLWAKRQKMTTVHDRFGGERRRVSGGCIILSSIKTYPETG